MTHGGVIPLLDPINSYALEVFDRIITEHKKHKYGYINDMSKDVAQTLLLSRSRRQSMATEVFVLLFPVVSRIVSVH